MLLSKYWKNIYNGHFLTRHVPTKLDNAFIDLTGAYDAYFAQQRQTTQLSYSTV